MVKLVFLVFQYSTNYFRNISNNLIGKYYFFSA